MKKLLLLAVMLLLAACGNEADESGAQTPEGQNEETVESPEGESQPEEEEESSMTASELLDEASSAWGDTVSYEARQTSTISSGESQYVVRTITTRSEADEIKVEVDDGEEIKTHYIVEGEHFIYQGGSTEAQDTPREIGGSEYGVLISDLEPYREGTLTEVESGYELRYTMDEKADAEPFFNDGMADMLDDVDTFSGQVTLQFNDEYQYTGAKFTLTVGAGEEEMNVISNITMDRIGEVDRIEKPKNM
ncbi:hypothetical protein ACBR55_11430 [Salinicoccus roseus]|jgi:hypothetical protein|uniref:hypothetical protein n=1 Tax=Salinicoccus roseus TaxID=45670 RepID=UPI001CA6D424|nr:hypothetical protein [Salinicoccus roseus]MBY8908506.1 hypothetical protein [Salinicoccus roseus]